VIYGIDAMLPGMKFATLAQCPVLGGKVANIDDKAATKIPGVRQIVVLDDLVAVVGDHMWAAKRGLEALEITWDEGKNSVFYLPPIKKRAGARAPRRCLLLPRTLRQLRRERTQGRAAQSS
jgi:CO/xanthine dehydrogenase Mo-binding subunit